METACLVLATPHMALHLYHATVVPCQLRDVRFFVAASAHVSSSSLKGELQSATVMAVGGAPGAKKHKGRKPKSQRKKGKKKGHRNRK